MFYENVVSLLYGPVLGMVLFFPIFQLYGFGSVRSGYYFSFHLV